LQPVKLLIMPLKARRTGFILIASLFCAAAYSQDSIRQERSAIFFPQEMKNINWEASIGFTLLTTPEDIAEEVRLRAPAGDFHVLRRLSDRWLIDGRILFQFVQNHFSVGPKFIIPVSERLHLSIGDDFAYWFGKLQVGGFDSKAHGWLNYPNFSVGYKANHDLLITLKAEASINLSFKGTNGGNEIFSDNAFYNGEALSIVLEQPFYHKKHLTLAFTAISNYFYWQTWSLFYKVDRRIFYPQVTVGFIL
jgi:hypothetical protein